MKKIFALLMVFSLAAIGCESKPTTGGTAKATGKADAPKTDAPKADAPKADAPKADAPKGDAPKADKAK